MVLTASLPSAFEAAQLFARNQSAHEFAGWSSFLISAPRPIIHGIWRLMSPGIQVMLLEAFPCDGNPPLMPLVRPMGIKLLKGKCETGIVITQAPVYGMDSVISAGETSLLKIPGTHYRINPIEDSCIFLVVRLPPFPEAIASRPRRIEQLDPRNLSFFKGVAQRLLAD